MDYAASLSRVLEKVKNSIRHRLSTEMPAFLAICSLDILPAFAGEP